DSSAARSSLLNRWANGSLESVDWEDAGAASIAVWWSITASAPGRNARRASIRAWGVGKRSAGFFAIKRATTAASAGGVCPLGKTSNGGGAEVCLTSVSTRE